MIGITFQVLIIKTVVCLLNLVMKFMTFVLISVFMFNLKLIFVRICYLVQCIKMRFDQISIMCFTLLILNFTS